MSSNFEFVNPQLFWLLLVLPLLLLWFFWKRKQQTAVLKISSLKGFDTSKNWLAKLRPLLFVLRLITLALIIVAMARPRTVDESTRIKELIKDKIDKAKHHEKLLEYRGGFKVSAFICFKKIAFVVSEFITLLASSTFTL